MSRLNELIGELCPDGVEYKKLWEVTIWNKRFNSVDNNKQPKIIKYHIYKSNDLDSMAVEDGNIRIMTTYCSPEDEIKYTTYELAKNTICEGEIIVIPGGGNACIQYHNGEFITADNRIATSIDTEYLNNRFLYFYLLNNLDTIKTYFRGAGIKHPDMSKILEIPVPIPPLPVQLKIVRILGNYNSYGTELLTELTIELTARKKQYEYYSNLLLKFEGQRNNDVQWVSLSEVADIGTGSSNTNEELEVGNYPFFVRSQDVRKKNTYEYDETAIITSGDGGVGKIYHYVEGKYALHQRAYRIHITCKRILSKYFFYYMKNTFLQYIEKNSFHSSVTSIRRPMLNNFPVPIPSLEEQERIVSILDRFDTLCNDLTIGLPAEIEARRKQYEYYRDKLLTFKEKTQ